MPRRRLEGHEAGDRVTLQARTTLVMRQRMEAAAKLSGRSLSQEMEFRLERSFHADDLREVVRDEFRRQREDADVPSPNMSADDLREWRGH